ncbi:MAG: phosphate regulon transcriptional regulator PhoB [Gammaproteobacteria bacterium]
MRLKILVVEDEPEIRELLKFSLERADYDVIEAESGEAAISLLSDKKPDVAVVDWMLPGMSGVALAKRLRKDEFTSEIPLLMLTAKSEETDLLKSFDAGFDDYMSKPFSPKELVARLKALVRRSGLSDDGVLEAAGIRIDKSSHKVTVDGQTLAIGPTEYRLLEVLLRNPDRVFERDQLLDRVWGRSTYIETRTVDVHILRLRKLLKPFGLDGAVQTVRSVGYRFSSSNR